MYNWTLIFVPLSTPINAGMFLFLLARLASISDVGEWVRSGTVTTLRRLRRAFKVSLQCRVFDVFGVRPHKSKLRYEDVGEKWHYHQW